MKKFIHAFTAAALAAGCLCACADSAQSQETDSDTIKIVAAIFPEYDWVINVLADSPAETEVTLLMDNGVDLHSYQPSAADILKICECDIFIYTGGESDTWVKDVLAQSENEEMTVISLMDCLGGGVKEEELAEGMQAEEEEDEEEETEYDEHVWLSLKNASLFVNAIAEAIAQKDPDNSAVYSTNAAAYIEKLNALDTAYEEAVCQAEVTTLLFADRFPFRYLTDDYGLSYYAAFPGCSAETEASFETIIFLAGKADELNLHAVITIDGSSQKIAETVIQNTQAKDLQILSMNSMQSVSIDSIRNGVSYLSIMEDNLSVLKEALRQEESDGTVNG